ncbi:hypothetical protein ACTXT7_008871 [Hymenolepis weldensis]
MKEKIVTEGIKLITNDVTVLLNNDKIEIETVTAEEAAEMISNIAYVKPRSTSTQLTYEPAGSKDRVIEIVTAVRCGGQDLGNISTSIIPLILDESISEPSVDSADPFYSGWMPQNEVVVRQSPPVATPPKPQPKSSLVLAVIGEETIRADIPVMEPGIIIFPGLEFTFTNVPFSMVEGIAEQEFIQKALNLVMGEGIRLREISHMFQISLFRIYRKRLLETTNYLPLSAADSC